MDIILVRTQRSKVAKPQARSSQIKTKMVMIYALAIFAFQHHVSRRSNMSQTEPSIVIPVHPAVKANLGNRQQLLIKKPNQKEFSRLRTAFESSPEASYDFLVNERNNWVRNGHPEYFNAEYRIENHNNFWK